MMPVPPFFGQAFEKGGRSTTLQPLGWLAAFTISGAILAGTCGAPQWLTIMLGGFAGITILTYLIAYIYFAKTDKDCLRSETYAIQKYAIQSGLIGDGRTGIKQVRGNDPLSEAFFNPINQTEENGE